LWSLQQPAPPQRCIAWSPASSSSGLDGSGAGRGEDTRGSRSFTQPIGSSRRPGKVGSQGATGAALPSATWQAARQGCVLVGGAGPRRAAERWGAQGCSAPGGLADPAPALRISSEPGQAVCGAPLCGLPALEGDGSAGPGGGMRRTGAELEQGPRQLTGRLGGDGPSDFRQTTEMLEMASGRAVGRLAPLAAGAS
jgi:hypothetical protein